MRRPSILCLLLAVLAFAAAAPAWPDGPPRDAPRLAFASVETGRALLGRRDDFVDRQSPFDRVARLQRDTPAGTEDYLDFVRASVRPWPDDARAAVEAAYATLRPALDALALPWPAVVTLVHTSGREEAGAAYTRGDAIVLPPGALASDARRMLPHLLAHELFHVLSRDNPQLKERAYAAIGFTPCGEIPLPSPLRERRITNPDAPRNDHCIEVEIDGAPRRALPILYARAPYDTRGGKPFFDYLEVRLLVVDAAAPGAPPYDDVHPRLIALETAKGFLEQVGRNTGYLIHPEEILADNFALLATGARDVRSPDVLARVAAALRAPSR